MKLEKPISFGAPNICDKERDAVMRVLSGTRLVHGPVAEEFEQRFAKRAGVAHAISVSSCTAGLHLGLHIEGVGPGDEVIVPAMTHVATAHAVEYTGAKPVFVDIEPDTGNLNCDALDDAMGRDTRAVSVVHYLGLPCQMDKITDTAAKYDAFVMEDCALALDATYGGRKAGGLGRLGSFSFYPVKHMTTAEGGMVTTDNDSVAEKLRNMKAFGYDRQLGQRDIPGIYDVINLGYNFRMSEVHAAIGLAQLEKLDGFLDQRRRNYVALLHNLEELKEVHVPVSVKGVAKSSFYCLNVVLPKDNSVPRNEVAKKLKQIGVGFSVHYPKSVPLFSYYRQKYRYREGMFPIAEWFADQTLSLPVGPHLNEADMSTISQALKEAIAAARK